MGASKALRTSSPRAGYSSSRFSEGQTHLAYKNLFSFEILIFILALGLGPLFLVKQLSWPSYGKESFLSFLGQLL